MSTPQELPELLKAAANLVSSHWKREHSALLLSTLGHQLSAQGLDVPRILQGRKLSEVLRNEASEVMVERASPDSTVMGVVPRSAEGQASKAIAKLTQNEASTNAPPRIHPAIWAAFTKPIPEGASRFISLDPPDFKDEQRVPGTTELTVAPTDIVPRGALTPSEHNQKTFDSLSNWLQRTSTTLSEVLYSQGARTNPIKAGDTLLARVMSALSSDQKKRLTLPLDIVEALLKA